MGGCRKTSHVTGARNAAARATASALAAARGGVLRPKRCRGGPEKRRAIQRASSRHPANPPIGNRGPLRGDLTTWWLANTPRVLAGRSHGGLTICRVSWSTPHRITDPVCVGTSPVSAAAPGPSRGCQTRFPQPIFAPAAAPRDPQSHSQTHQEFCDTLWGLANSPPDLPVRPGPGASPPVGRSNPHRTTDANQT